MSIRLRTVPPSRRNLSEPKTYQTLSPARRTFVFLGSRCTRPLTHVMRMFSVANFQNGGQAKEGNRKNKAILQ